jgi:hypothetical protein
MPTGAAHAAIELSDMRIIAGSLVVAGNTMQRTRP